MAKKPETKFKEKVIADLRRFRRETRAPLWFVKIQQMSIHGTPDFLMCAGGVFVGLELKKSEDEEPEPLQTLVLSSITRAGGKSFVAYPENWEGILEEIKKLTLRFSPNLPLLKE